MSAKRKPRSQASAAAWETALGLHKVGLLSDEKLRWFEESCLEPVALSPRQIQAMRKREQMSQARFAYAIGVSVSSVRSWETGLHKPSAPSLRKLQELSAKHKNGATSRTNGR